MADDATRGERQTTTTSNKSGRWKTQGNDNCGDNGSGDDVPLVVRSAGVGWHDESGRGEEDDTVMAADVYRQQSTKSVGGNGRCDGDSNDNGNSNGDGDGNGATATATTINNKQQQKKRRRSWQQKQQKWRQRWRKLWWQRWQSLLAPVKGRGIIAATIAAEFLPPPPPFLLLPLGLHG
jgi:hypothetical protein